MFIWDRCYLHTNGYGPLESNADKYEPLSITSECRSVDSSTIYFRCKVCSGFDHKSGWTNKRDENQQPLERCVREPIVPQLILQYAICNMIRTNSRRPLERRVRENQSCRRLSSDWRLDLLSSRAQAEADQSIIFTQISFSFYPLDHMEIGEGEGRPMHY